MPHYSIFWQADARGHHGTGVDNHDTQANFDTAYLLDDGVDEANGEIIVPAVHVEELTTFPPVGKSNGEGTDMFAWSAADPAHDTGGSDGATVGADVTITVGVNQIETVRVDDALF